MSCTLSQADRDLAQVPVPGAPHLPVPLPCSSSCSWPCRSAGPGSARRDATFSARQEQARARGQAVQADLRLGPRPRMRPIGSSPLPLVCVYHRRWEAATVARFPAPIFTSPSVASLKCRLAKKVLHSRPQTCFQAFSSLHAVGNEPLRKRPIAPICVRQAIRPCSPAHGWSPFRAARGASPSGRSPQERAKSTFDMLPTFEYTMHVTTSHHVWSGHGAGW